MINDSEIKERFASFGPATVEAIRGFHSSHDPKFVSPIVHGIIEKYLPPGRQAMGIEEMKSLNSFGIESVTLMEIILDIQDAFDLVISDAELRGLKNFDDATRLLSDKVAALRDGKTAAS